MIELINRLEKNRVRNRKRVSQGARNADDVRKPEVTDVLNSARDYLGR